MAKGIGGGFPVGACLATNKAASAFEPGDHGNTFGGNPLACSVANTVIDEILSENLLENVKTAGAYIIDKLTTLKDKYSVIKDIRGKGLLIGMEIDGTIKDFQNTCFQNKLLLIPAGASTIRILPPLNVNKDEIDEMLLVFEKSIVDFSGIQ